jgi:FkbM family methyltransferase
MIPYCSDDPVDLGDNSDFVTHAAKPQSHVGLLLEEVIHQINHPKAISSLVNPVIVDLGANVGIFSLYYSRWAKRVYAVEPMGSNLTVLASNVRQFGKDKVQVIPLAVSDRNGDVDFFEGDTNSTANSIVRDPYHSRVHKAKQISLNLLLHNIILREGKIDFVKMDIEGAETMALRSLSPEVAAKVWSFYIECHVCQRVNPVEIEGIMTSLGYRVDRLGDNKLFCVRPISDNV